MVRQMLPDGFNPADVLEVLQYCAENDAVDTGAVVKKFGSGAVDAIAWLFKKGFVGSRNAADNSFKESVTFAEVG